MSLILFGYVLHKAQLDQFGVDLVTFKYGCHWSHSPSHSEQGMARFIYDWVN